MQVSDIESYLGQLGLTTEYIVGEDDKRYLVVTKYPLPAGSLAGRVCDIAIECVESVPYVPPAAIHTRPHLVPMVMRDPLKTQASGIGSEWQYWSRRYDHRPTPMALWAHIVTVLCDDQWPVI